MGTARVSPCSQENLSRGAQEKMLGTRGAEQEGDAQEGPLLGDTGKKELFLLSAAHLGIDTGLGMLVAWPPALLHGFLAL